MTEGVLKLNSPEWGWPILAGLAIALVVLLLGYRHQRLPGWVKASALLLKMIALVALAFCLLEPMRSGQRPRPQANAIPIMLDASQSMRIGFADPSQAVQAQAETFRSESPWLVRLSQEFDVRPYAFASRLRSVDDLSKVTSDGSATALYGSLQTLAKRFQGRPVAGVLLFTDGNVTEAEDLQADWSQLGVPVYPVMRARPEMRDLRIASTTISQSDFEAAPVTIDVRLEATDLAGREAVVDVQDQSGTTIETQTVGLPADGKQADVRFRFRPPTSGIQFFTVATCLSEETERFAAGTSDIEATLANNRQVVLVDRPQGPFRILYVAGRPNWEFKFLRRALAEDAEVELTGLIRIAKRQPKFSFRDSRVPATNPLFAGLGSSEEEAAEEYDEPVILRLGVDEAEDLKTGFPSEPEELFAYDAVILDDVEAAFFSTDQQLLLRKFVSARGGGLMALGGQETFAKGQYEATPIGDMLPVYLQSPRASASTPSDGNPTLRFELTREGMLQPWLRLRATELEEQQRLRTIAPLQVFQRIESVKPGAEVLATVAQKSDPEQRYPAIVTQRFGSGRASAVLVGDVWRWFMRRESLDSGGSSTEAAAIDPAQAWRQWVRWLVSDVPQAVEVKVRDADSATQPLTLEVAVRDELFQPLDNAGVALTITNPDGSETELEATADERQAGVYRTSYWSPQSGGFRASVTVKRADGSIQGVVEAGWVADRSAAEFRHLANNVSLLEELAAATGGQMVAVEELDAFTETLSAKEMPVMETWTYPIWHRPWMLLIAVSCLCGEWALRRWKGWP